MMASVILIGDSVRMLYQPLVQAALDESTVWGPAHNCETSRRILACLDDWVIARDPDVVHLNCGLHDLRYDPGAENRVVSPTEYVENISRIMEELTSRTSARIIWATTTPVNERWHQACKVSRRYEADVALYNRLALQAVAPFGVRINDLLGAVTARGRDRLLQEDGVHFTDEGYRLLSREVVTAIRQAMSTALA
jgi:lysophospholipase L1-like esterase